MTSKSSPITQLSPRDLAQMIDISAVQIFHNSSDIEDVAQIALAEEFIAVHALPHFTSQLRKLIPKDSNVLVGGPIGFPSGGNKTETKLTEAQGLIHDGATEVDMMMNIGRLKSEDDSYVIKEITTIVDAVTPIPVKVIIEVSVLSDEEIQRASKLVAQTDAAFVKTGTGWTGKPTTLKHIKMIREAAGPNIGIKASGGIRELSTIADMLAAGATRFGINTKVARKLVAECKKLPNGVLSISRNT